MFCPPPLPHPLIIPAYSANIIYGITAANKTDASRQQSAWSHLQLCIGQTDYPPVRQMFNLCLSHVVCSVSK